MAFFAAAATSAFFAGFARVVGLADGCPGLVDVDALGSGLLALPDGDGDVDDDDDPDGEGAEEDGSAGCVVRAVVAGVVGCGFEVDRVVTGPLRSRATTSTILSLSGVTVPSPGLTARTWSARASADWVAAR